MLPRGEITRDQLSALLLGYVGTAADTLELFEVFEEEQLKGKLAITQAVVGVFCWSLLQFTLVTTATTGKDNQIKITSHKVRNYCLVSVLFLVGVSNRPMYSPILRASDRMQQCGIASYGKICIHHILRAFPHDFEEIIKNYGLKLLDIFFVKKVLHSFHIFPSE